MCEWGMTYCLIGIYMVSVYILCFLLWCQTHLLMITTLRMDYFLHFQDRNLYRLGLWYFNELKIWIISSIKILSWSIILDIFMLLMLYVTWASLFFPTLIPDSFCIIYRYSWSCFLTFKCGLFCLSRLELRFPSSSLWHPPCPLRACSGKSKVAWEYQSQTQK